MKNDLHFTHQDYDVTQSEILYEGIFRLVRYDVKHALFNGDWSPVYSREVLERESAAAVLPYDPVLDRVILIEQFRIGALKDHSSPWLLEIPAGLTDKFPPIETAYIEAMEEANCKILKLEPICEYFVSPGGSNEYLNLYCGKINAKNIKGVFGLKDEQEDIRVLNLSATEAFAKLNSGQIKTAPAIISLFWLQLNHKRLQETW